MHRSVEDWRAIIGERYRIYHVDENQSLDCIDQGHLHTHLIDFNLGITHVFQDSVVVGTIYYQLAGGVHSG